MTRWTDDLPVFPLGIRAKNALEMRTSASQYHVGNGDFEGRRP